ncbi:MAG: hypothetical protein ACI4OR_00475 [Alphaproteobacteria bacterium]
MRFAESKKKMPWVKIVLIFVALGILSFSFCEFRPVQKTTQKTVVFEAD